MQGYKNLAECSFKATENQDLGCTTKTMEIKILECRIIRIPFSSAALISASALTKSSTMPSIASLAAIMRGVAPSSIRAFKLVLRFLNKIYI